MTRLERFTERTTGRGGRSLKIKTLGMVAHRGEKNAAD